MGRTRFSVAGLMALVFMAAIGVASLLFASQTWMRAIVLLTLAILTTAILAVVYRQGERRAFWLGFVLFGWGYMALSWGDSRDELITSSVLESIEPLFRTARYSGKDRSTFAKWLTGAHPRNELIEAKLEEPISMAFANETPLEDVLKYIRSATTGPKDSGFPIYVDPAGLQKAEKTMTSPVQIDLEGLPLRTTLRLMLKQLGMTYTVKDGLLTIDSQSISVNAVEPFQRIGHCYWALLAGCLGGIAGRFLHATR